MALQPLPFTYFHSFWPQNHEKYAYWDFFRVIPTPLFRSYHDSHMRHNSCPGSSLSNSPLSTKKHAPIPPHYFQDQKSWCWKIFNSHEVKEIKKTLKIRLLDQSNYGTYLLFLHNSTMKSSCLFGQITFNLYFCKYEQRLIGIGISGW